MAYFIGVSLISISDNHLLNIQTRRKITLKGPLDSRVKRLLNRLWRKLRGFEKKHDLEQLSSDSEDRW